MENIFSSARTQILIGTASTICSLIYMYVQYTVLNTLEDAIFTGMLLGATIFLCWSIRTVFNFIDNNYIHFIISSGIDEKEFTERQDKFLKIVFNTRYMFIFGFLYGSGAFYFPYYFNIWPENSSLRIALSSFLFITNFNTGVAVYGIGAYFNQVMIESKFLKIDIHRIHTQSTEFLMKSARIFSLRSSIYVSISLSSVAFSKFPASIEFFVLGVFGALVFFFTLIVPYLSISNKVSEKKKEVIEKLDKEIFGSVLGDEDGLSESNYDVNRIEVLLTIRKNIATISVFPQKFQTILAGLGIAMASSLPVVVQYFFEFFGLSS